MDRVGLIGAMPMELEPLMARLEDAREEHVGPLTFHLGKIAGVAVVVGCCGIGKVNAAMGAQAMLQAYQPRRVIHVGVGGGLIGRLKVGDVVIASGCVQYDVDTTALGDPPGFVSTVNKIEFECDRDVREDILAAANGMAERRFELFSGRVATGDRFLTRRQEKQRIVDDFSALTCDQESCAIAQVCCIHGTPVAVIRAVSDASDDAHADEYASFAPAAAENAASVALRYLESLSVAQQK
ncbi:MAG: 5'-methylthioadenosine/adenosylhomocysteine nucleosidase [Candidatus Faecivicinus sp.]